MERNYKENIKICELMSCPRTQGMANNRTYQYQASCHHYTEWSNLRECKISESSEREKVM